MKIRLVTYKSFRHYGGREITSESHLVSAKLVKTQEGPQKYIVQLLEDGAGYKKGHVIAISESEA